MAVFSDSQLRPIVQGDIRVKDEWYVNCTPGGRFAHVADEIYAVKFPKRAIPQIVVLLVGTNDMSADCALGRSRANFKALLAATKKKFASARVSFSCM